MLRGFSLERRLGHVVEYPRYPRRRFTPCAPGRFLAVSVDLEATEDHGLKRIRAASTSPGAPGSNEQRATINDQQPIMSDRCCVASCAPERQAGPASEDSCSKFQMLNAKCSVLSALHPRYPRGSFTRCAPGNNIATILDQELTVSRFRRKNCFLGLRGGLILGSLRLKYWTAHFGCARKNRSPAACVIV